MIDWLALWGVTQAVGFVFKPILEYLAKDTAKDYVKDFFKSCLSNVLPLPNSQQTEKQQETLKIVTGKAITEFLKLIQQELEDADLEYIQIQQYNLSLEEFIKDQQVAEALGQVFIDQNSLNTKLLKERWQKLEVGKTFLPNAFNWEQVAKRYQKKVKAIIQETPELREILNSQNLEKLAEAVPVQPEFDLIKYQEGILEQYGNLKLESLDTTGCAYKILKSRAENDKNPSVRCAAVEELGQGYTDHPETLNILKSCAENDESSSVRYVAVEELGQGYTDHPETLNILKSCAENDESSSVRYAAVQELAQGWKDEPSMFEFLQDRALHDPFKHGHGFQNSPREFALKTIVKNYPNHPQTLPLLRDRAENDPDEQLRTWANKQLE